MPRVAGVAPGGFVYQLNRAVARLPLLQWVEKWERKWDAARF